MEAERSECERGARGRRSAESGFAVPLDASADPHHVGARRVDFPRRDAHQLSLRAPRAIEWAESGSPSEKKIREMLLVSAPPSMLCGEHKKGCLMTWSIHF
jgi:hypothetical protein